jgi:hypothetical protein
MSIETGQFFIGFYVIGTMGVIGGFLDEWFVGGPVHSACSRNFSIKFPHPNLISGLSCDMQNMVF